MAIADDKNRTIAKSLFAKKEILPSIENFTDSKYSQPDFFYTLSSLKNTNLLILTAMSTELQTGLLRRFLPIAGISLCLSLLLSIFLGFWLSQQISPALKEIIEGLQEVSNGIYSRHIGCEATGEVQEAIHAFNQMVEKLKKQKLIEKIWIEDWHADENEEK